MRQLLVLPGFLAGIVITDLVSLILVAAYLGAWIGIAYLAVSILSGLLVMKAIVTAQQRRYVLPGIPLTDEQGSNAMVTVIASMMTWSPGIISNLAAGLLVWQPIRRHVARHIFDVWMTRRPPDASERSETEILIEEEPTQDPGRDYVN